MEKKLFITPTKQERNSTENYVSKIKTVLNHRNSAARRQTLVSHNPPEGDIKSDGEQHVSDGFFLPESERQEGDQLCWDGLSAQISIFYNLHYGTVGIEMDVFLSTPCQSEEYPLSNGPEGVLPLPRS